MSIPQVLCLPALALPTSITPESPGTEILAAIVNLAEQMVGHLHAERQRLKLDHLAAVGRLRGTGRGVHFSRFVDRLEAELPLKMESPFENSHLVAGAAWPCQEGAGALAKLVWAKGADDLPMHAHEHSDRFIIVDKGRGYFHVSDQDVESFDGSDVRSVPARERDIFMFTRGTVHTFSTANEPITLLSCQMPFVGFNDRSQYRLPQTRWTARGHAEQQRVTIGCDPAWTAVNSTPTCSRSPQA